MPSFRGPWRESTGPDAQWQAAPADRDRYQQNGQAAHAWDAIVIDEPVEFFEPRAQKTGSYRPDIEADGWATDRILLRSASVRGYSHRYYELPRQDCVRTALHRPSGSVLFAVADGVSNADRSEQGALLACNAAIHELVVQLEKDNAEPDWAAVTGRAAHALVGFAAREVFRPRPALPGRWVRLFLP